MLRLMTYLFGAVLVTALFVQDSFAAEQSVLIIHSYEESLEWTQQCNRGIMSSLPDGVSTHTIYLNTKKIPQSEFQAAAQAALAEYRRLQPDVVMLGDDNALRLLGPMIAEDGTPVVYFGINGNPRWYFDELPPNVYGVIERIPLFHWIRLLLDIVPGARNVLVLADSSPTADAILDAAFHGRHSIDLHGKSIRWRKARSWEQWQDCVQKGGWDIILTPIYHALQDESGQHVDYTTVVSWTSEHSPVPVFAAQDYAVGDNGFVGALVLVGDEHGRLAGRIVRDILEGKDSRAISTNDDQQGELFFNRKQLDRFGIILPEGLERKISYR